LIDTTAGTLRQKNKTMTDPKDFREQAHLFVDWMADYLENIEQYPVKSQVRPGEVFRQLPGSPPEEGELMPAIFDDFRNIIIPGMTHWQSPNFFAYFPANSSYPSVLAEMLTATMGAQCMKWETSPAAAELEEVVMAWLKEMTGLPPGFHGVIQDTASTSTLAAIITAREKYSGFKVNENGFGELLNPVVYCSEETHSSIEKAVKIAGIGRQNLVKVDVDRNFAMDPEALEEAIKKDLGSGNKPLCIVATLGTTGSTAIDPLKEIAVVARKYNLWLHVDAAFAGSALILPEYRWMIEGIEEVDSFVFNPHKWLFTNFDCSAYFVKDKESLVKTFQLIPEYLKTRNQDKVNDYSDWGIPLGRRFRALKLWFVIRSFGVKGLRSKLQDHLFLANKFAHSIMVHDHFELMAPVNFNLVCFRYIPPDLEGQALDRINEDLLHRINATGKIYLSHTRLDGRYTLRMSIAQTRVQESHVDEAWMIIREEARK
jgi:aromatic-L-amino-acid decarboxylase